MAFGHCDGPGWRRAGAAFQRRDRAGAAARGPAPAREGGRRRKGATIAQIVADGTPRSRAAIVAALAGRYPRGDVRLAIMRLAVLGQLAELGGKFTLAEPEAGPG